MRSNPSLERRPHEAGRLSSNVRRHRNAVCGGRRLHEPSHYGRRGALCRGRIRILCLRLVARAPCHGATRARCSVLNGSPALQPSSQSHHATFGRLMRVHSCAAPPRLARPQRAGCRPRQVRLGHGSFCSQCAALRRPAKPGSVAAPAEYRPCYWRPHASGGRIHGMRASAPQLQRLHVEQPSQWQVRGRLAAGAVPPNPSLERRPHEAGRPWAAQGSRRLHCPTRPKGAPPRGSPQLER